MGMNKMNQFMNRSNQSMGINHQFISPLKPGQNSVSVSDNKKTPNMQNKFDNQANQINKSVGTNRTISSQNLENFTFNDFYGFNTLPPTDINDFSFGNNNLNNNNTLENNKNNKN